MKQENDQYWEKTVTEDGGVKAAIASFTDAHAHTETQSRALTLGSLLIVAYAKETKDRPIVWAKREALWRHTAIIMTSAITYMRLPASPCRILTLLDATIYETKNIPRSTANSPPPEPPIRPTSVCKFCTMSVAFSWTAVGHWWYFVLES